MPIHEPIPFESARKLDELTERVRLSLSARGVMVGTFTDHGHHVLANSGFLPPVDLPDPMPLRYSICRHIVAMNFPLAVDNAADHPLLKDTPAVTELWVGAYLGAPVRQEDGQASGALCALEVSPRRWTTQDIALMINAAQVADRILAETPDWPDP